ncbi:MAG: GNAT family N-acetyltransferase [Anaerolineales bacterium]|nr:GNAT family N-acetyltransferase [Anaerolineales bacterium]
MISLMPMEQDEFDTFFEGNIVRYAEENVRSGRWQQQEALEKSRASFRGFLPNGLQSKDQYVFHIFDNEQDLKIGILWVEVKMDEPHRPAFIFDFVIDEPCRGRGLGNKSLLALDEKLKQMGAESVALHVFGYNTTAFELYKKMGYEVTDINMRKNYK